MNSRGGLLFTFVLSLAVVGGVGCRRNIVHAVPPSVAAPPAVQPLPAPEPPAATTAAAPAPAPVPPEPGDTPAPENISPESASAPARPQPAPTAPRPKPEAPAPVIAPELSPRQQADASRSTNDDMRSAERNLQMVSGKQLQAGQQDLVDKIQGFLSQAHEAITAEDWIRAQNLAHKAQVLSVELNRSF